MARIIYREKSIHQIYKIFSSFPRATIPPIYKEARNVQDDGIAPKDLIWRRVSFVWYDLFNVEQFETKTWKFGGYNITTNNSDVSILMALIKPEKRANRMDDMVTRIKMLAAVTRRRIRRARKIRRTKFQSQLLLLT